MLSGLGAILFITGCAGAGADTRRRLDELEQALILAQNRNDRLEERVAALEAASDSQAQGMGSEQGASEEHGPELPVVRLRPETEEPRDGDPKPDVLESGSATESPEDQPAGTRPGSGQSNPNKGTSKSAAPAADKPREVIKVHPEGSQSSLDRPSAPGRAAPWEGHSR